MRKLFISILAASFCIGRAALAALPSAPWAFIDQQISSHPGKTGVYVLDTGFDALLARAWLADHASETIEVQYFIWSTDNIGILASEALLRAAERGVQVRVIVDDLTVEAPDKFLLALAKHPNVGIRIYNPKHSVGTPGHKRALNIAIDFRGVNQRMHDKTFIVDGKVAITGGRNMADEYFDYNSEYNFRDRDALLVGQAVKDMRASFERFWTSPLSVDVETLYAGRGLLNKNVEVDADEAQRIYSELHAYARTPYNFAPQVRAAIENAPASFPALAADIVWSEVAFISDQPGKNRNRSGLGGGGLSTSALARLVEDAKTQITIQSPYLVLSDKAMALFKKAISRGVRIRVNTNSLASTDNLLAFSGYRNQRRKLLKMGLEIYEYKPNPQAQIALMQSALRLNDKRPIFAVHAKTMVADGKIVYIGTYNLDPRSENLNTEVGVVVRNPILAKMVEAKIETDMRPENSWNAATDQPDRYVPLSKRGKVRFWQNMPIKPLL